VTGTRGGISGIRLLLGAGGGLLALYGLSRLVTETAGGHLLVLAGWLVGALVLHDAVLSPMIIALGALLRRVPARARSYVQGALVAGGTVTVIAIPLILRAGRQPDVKAILDQDFPANLTVLLALIALTAVSSYLLRVVREHRTADHALDD
jgi:hypothetical protein